MVSKKISCSICILILFFINGLLNAQIQLTLPTASGAPGEVKALPVTVNDITSYNIYSYTIEIDYDTTIMKITGISTTGTVMAGKGSPVINSDTTKGFIRIAWATGDNPLTGSGTFIYLNIVLKAIGSSSITLGNASNINPSATNKFYNKNGQVVTHSVTNGTITVSAVNNPPQFNSIPNQTVNEGDTLTFTVSATDPDGDSVTVSHGPLPQGASFDSTSGQFTWQPTVGQAGNYTVTFYASDGDSTSQLDVNIEVVHVNSAPVFTKEPENNTVVPVHNVPVYYKFQYEAEDADGDSLIFSLVKGPSGSSISTSGLFLWAPVPEQAGQTYNVIVLVTDSIDSVTSTRTLKVADTVTSVGKEPELPNKYELMQNYPNPFNPTTTIEFEIPKQTYVSLEVFNLLGQHVALLINKYMPAGRYTINFDAKNLQSGIYFYKLTTNEITITKKMALIK